jgi:hypothetical protein
MFYCNKCRKENKLPESLFKSYGKYEICDEVSECNDIPSSRLTIN